MRSCCSGRLAGRRRRDAAHYALLLLSPHVGRRLLHRQGYHDTDRKDQNRDTGANEQESHFQLLSFTRRGNSRTTALRSVTEPSLNPPRGFNRLFLRALRVSVVRKHPRRSVTLSPFPVARKGREVTRSRCPQPTHHPPDAAPATCNQHCRA